MKPTFTLRNLFRCAGAFRDALLHRTIGLILLCVVMNTALCLPSWAQAQDREEEIVANLAGGRVIVQVASDRQIIFAAINQPVEAGGVPPRVMDLDGAHIGILLGASEWRSLADPNPVRLDKNFHRIGPRDPHDIADPNGAEPDLETIGVAFLEELRPLVAQLHHKIQIVDDEPLLEVVIIGFAPDEYGPEVWTAEYRIEQEQVATRGEYWQTRVLRPRFTQIYPPEKHAPRVPVEARYPTDMKTPPLTDLIQGNDPRIAGLGRSDPKFAKVIEAIDRGQSQKAPAQDSTDFMRALLPLIAGNSKFIMGTMEEQRGFDWIVPPDEPVEKAKKDKNAPQEPPTLRRRPQP
jgi:hypothetical protein